MFKEETLKEYILQIDPNDIEGSKAKINKALTEIMETITEEMTEDQKTTFTN